MTSSARDVRFGRRGGGWVDGPVPSAFDEVYEAERARKAARRRPAAAVAGDDDEEQLELFGEEGL